VMQFDVHVLDLELCISECDCCIVTAVSVSNTQNC
jgi:hypothetical protein